MANIHDLRARARAAGIPVGTLLQAERKRRAQALATGASRTARAAGTLTQPAHVDEAGVTWRVAAAPPAAVRGVAADLAELGFRTYAPLETFIVYRGRGPDGRRQRRIEQRPLLGAYLFVGERNEPLQKSIHPHLWDVLRTGDGPLSVPAAAIRAINDAELAGKWDHTRRATETAPFAPGEAVVVKAGAFAEFRATVEACERRGRVRIVLTMFGGETTATVLASDLIAA